MSAPPARNPARVALALAVLMLALGAIGGAHFYLLRRLVFDAGVTGPAAGWAVTLVAVLGVGMLAQPVLERFLRPPWLRIVSLPFVVWMGVLWLGVNALWASDLALWMMGASGGPGAEAVARHRALAVTGLVLVASVLALRGGLPVPRVRRVELRLPGWPAALDGFRIAQISDIHIGPVLGRGFAAELVRRVNALDADLVALTGDLVDGGVEQLREEVEPFAELRSRQGVYFVTGNHDVYSGGERWVERVRELGMRPLRNERVRIGGEDGFDLAGVDDHRGDWVHGSTEDLDAALEGRDPARPVVLLAHDPTTWKRARGLGVTLQLSGHTHGGQIWPFGLVVRLAVPFVAGLYRRGGRQLYVSRGTGFWGPPMRLLAPGEITEIVLRPEPAGVTP